MKLAKGVSYTCESGIVVETRPGVYDGAQHGYKSHGGIDGEDDIVKDNKGLECASFADGPGLVLAATIVVVEQGDCGNIDAGYGERHRWVQSCIVDLWVDREGALDGLFVRRRWERGRKICWWKLEERPRRQGEVD